MSGSRRCGSDRIVGSVLPDRTLPVKWNSKRHSYNSVSDSILLVGLLGLPIYFHGSYYLPSFESHTFRQCLIDTVQVRFVYS